FSQLGVLGKLCSESELSPQRLAFVHKAIETAFFRSWLRTVLVRRGLARIHTDSSIVSNRGLARILEWIKDWRLASAVYRQENTT
ncbi:MAG TPA: hypothetical protein VMW72_26665, partial [Sedimentisphaerales bacterium]|nr:hypothetical protein [Sedimentisphaerales bacterium]